MEWLDRWKEYVGFDGRSKGNHPGEITNFRLLDTTEQVAKL